MTILTIKGYTAEYRKDFNVPAGWPPRWRIERVVRPDQTAILPTTYAGVRVPASFRSQYSDIRQVRAKVENVIWWDTITEAERVAWLADDGAEMSQIVYDRCRVCGRLYPVDTRLLLPSETLEHLCAPCEDAHTDEVARLHEDDGSEPHGDYEREQFRKNQARRAGAAVDNYDLPL